MIFKKRKIKSWEVVLQLTLSATVMLILLYLLFTTKKWYWFPFSQLPILLIINFGIFDKIIMTEESISEKRLFSTKTLLLKEIKEIRLMSSNKNIGFIDESEMLNSHYTIRIYILPNENLNNFEDTGSPIIFDYNKEAWDYLKTRKNIS